jgi:SAM-dependent MidA family methyltransferase
MARNELATKLIARLGEHGPVSFRDFMEAALYDEKYGYYRTSPPKIGPAGDYYTSSNVHRVFGATLAGALSPLLAGLAGPPSERVTLVELGAGTGQLARDILETLKDEEPALFERLEYVVVESSPVMVELERQTLDGFQDRVRWAPLSDLGELRGVILSNEFFDALPVHVVRVSGTYLLEQYVAADPDSESGLKLLWQETSTPTIAEYMRRMSVKPAEHQTVEVGLDATSWMERISSALVEGFLVTIDYGDLVELLWGGDRPGGTLRSFRRHQLISSALEKPGEQDLTASVNFSALIEYGRTLGLEMVSYERQHSFLMRHGLVERVGWISGLQSRLAAKRFLVPGEGDNFRVLVQRRPGSP